ncbi:MAG: GDSL-type esterase/lipase family protein [Pseudomonadota bacterium]
MLRATITAIMVSLVTACSSLSDPAMDADIAADRPTGSVLWSGLTPRAHDHVNRRLDQIEALPVLQGGVLFVGDSITEGAPLQTMFPNLQLANHGIGWDTTEGVLLRLNQITRNRPARLFLLIGTNDTNYTDDPDRISDNILKVTDALTAALPDTELYVLSILPRGGPGNAVISDVNRSLRQAAIDRPFVFLNLAQAMRAENGEMRADLSYDNLHLNVQGYAVWEAVLRECVWNGCPQGLSE